MFLCDGLWKLNNDLQNIYKWIISNCFHIKPSFSMPVIIGNQYLGIIMNKSLTWNDYIDSVISKVSDMLRTLYKHATDLFCRTSQKVISNINLIVIPKITN